MATITTPTSKRWSGRVMDGQNDVFTDEIVPILYPFFLDGDG
jgi:hypothetical protein